MNKSGLRMGTKFACTVAEKCPVGELCSLENDPQLHTSSSICIINSCQLAVYDAGNVSRFGVPRNRGLAAEVPTGIRLESLYA